MRTRLPLSKTPVLLVTVCLAASRLVQVTVVPVATVIVGGKKAKPEISTSKGAVVGVGSVAVFGAGAGTGAGVGVGLAQALAPTRLARRRKTITRENAA